MLREQAQEPVPVLEWVLVQALNLTPISIYTIHPFLWGSMPDDTLLDAAENLRGNRN